MDTEVGARRGITRREIAGTIVVLVIVAVCFRLCQWQVHRLHEKRATNASIAARMSQAPIAGVNGIADTAGSLYRRIEIHATYDDAHTIILPGRSLDGVPGVHILTPAVLSSGTAVLVNRGWVPSPDAATVDLALVPHADGGTIVGLALAFPTRRASISETGDSVPPAGVFQRVWYTIDEHALRAQFPYPLASFMLQVLPAPGAPSMPRPLAAPTLGEGPHLSYAIQWFSFGMIAITGWLTFLVRRRSDRAGGRAVVAPPHPPSIT
jgi:surfeit locus 1 family protein